MIGEAGAATAVVPQPMLTLDVGESERGTRESGSFEDVFRSLLPRALSVARRLLGDEGLAEDAASEAFARAHASWRRIGALEYRDAWILRVTANVAVDIARKRGRTSLFGLIPLGGREPSEAGHDETVTNTLTLAKAIAGLPKRQREIVVLQYFEQMTESDIAASLGVSAGTVKKEGFRARKALRERLGEMSVAADPELELGDRGPFEAID